MQHVLVSWLGTAHFARRILSQGSGFCGPGPATQAPPMTANTNDDCSGRHDILSLQVDSLCASHDAGADIFPAPSACMYMFCRFFRSCSFGVYARNALC